MSPIERIASVLGIALVCMTGARGAFADPAMANPDGTSATAATSVRVEPGEALPPPSFTVAWSGVYASRYSFQGLDYSDGRPVWQPSVSASVLGLTAGLWGNVDQTRRELNEIDFTLQREFEHGVMSSALGYGYLDYPHREGWAATHEAYLDLAFDMPIAPSLSVHWDVDAGDGRYWTLALGRDFERAHGTIGVSAKLYAHEHYYGMSGFPALETGLSLTRLWRGFALQPSLARVWAWENGDFRDDLAITPGWVASLNLSPRE